MRFSNTRVMNFDGALRGMRNPMNSWHLSDSDASIDMCRYHGDEPEPAQCEDCPYFDGFGNPCLPKIGKNDMDLAQRLIRAGSEHRKFMRQIFVCVDVEAPIYWWNEYDTYKVGTAANSCSKMHKLASSKIEIRSFEIDDMSNLYLSNDGANDGIFQDLITYVDVHMEFLNRLQKKYNETKDKRYWKELVRWLPESWLQKRTLTLNYENLLSMCRQRDKHKLTEWESFRKWARTLPYANELIFIDEVKEDGQQEEASAT